MGFSAPRAGGARSMPADAGGAAASVVPADFRSSYTKLGERFPSDGHGRRYIATLWMNEPAHKAWAAHPDPMPDGAIVLEDMIDQDRAGERAAGLLVMEKKAGAWRFATVRPDGVTVTDARVAPGADCADCHRQAPHDDLFVEVTPEGR